MVTFPSLGSPSKITKENSKRHLKKMRTRFMDYTIASSSNPKKKKKKPTIIQDQENKLVLSESCALISLKS